MVRFEALELTLELVESLAPLLVRIERRNRNLADQLRRACTSVASCLAEGSRRTGKDRAYQFRVAEGSAAEVHVQLRLVVALRMIPAEELAAPIALADRVIGMCYGLTRGARTKAAPPAEVATQDGEGEGEFAD